MHITLYHTHPSLYRDVAQLFIDSLRNNPKTVWGLATGSTPIEIYKHLVAHYQKDAFDTRFLTTFNLDEYMGLSASSDQSYAHFMSRHLWDALNLQPNQRHIPNGLASDLVSECERYETLILEHPIHIQLLGIGSNGHIAFNEPGTPFDSKTHVVTLDSKTRMDNARFFDALHSVPHQAITMGISTIMKAQKIVLVATGQNKAKAIQAMLEGPISESCPASILRNHPNLFIYLDDKAASLLNTHLLNRG